MIVSLACLALGARRSRDSGFALQLYLAFCFGANRWVE
jgi:hypothetical protein